MSVMTPEAIKKAYPLTRQELVKYLNTHKLGAGRKWTERTVRLNKFKKIVDKAKAALRAPRIRQTVGRDISVKGTVVERQIIYGECRVPAVLTFVSISADNQILHLVLTCAGHEIDSLQKLFLDNEEVVFGASPDARWSTDIILTDGTLASAIPNCDPEHKIFMALNAGSASQTVQPDLYAILPTKWTTDHRQRGCAHAYLQLIWDTLLFPNGVPDICFQVRGKKVYDPVTGLTAYSNNAALIIADFLVDTTIGCGLDSSKIDWTSFTAARNICAETITLADSTTEARYTINGYFDSGDDRKEILRDMLGACAGTLIFSENKWKLKVGAYVTPTLTLTEDDVLSELTVTTKLGRNDTINGVRGTCVMPTSNWDEDDFPAVTNATYLAEDGEQFWADVQYPFTTSPNAAQRLAKIMLERSRQSIQVEGDFKLRAWALEPGDTVYFTYARFGWTSKAFEVKDVQLSPSTEEENLTFAASLTLRETASTVYDWSDGSETTVDAAPNTTLPNPFNVDAIADLTLASGTSELYVRADGTIFSRIKVSWTLPTDYSILSGGKVHIQYKKHADSEWSNAPSVLGSETFMHILDVQDGQAYDIRVRGESALGVFGAWTTESNYTVLGKTEPPSAVASLSAQFTGDGIRFTWPAVTDLDLAYYELRKGSTWLTADVIRTNERSLAWTYEFRTAGTNTFLVKAYDRTGNPSATAASASVTIQAPNPVSSLTTLAVNNQVQIDWQAPTVTSLPIKKYKVYKGATWAAAVLIGEAYGTFLAYIERSGGTYTYWVTAVDEGENESSAVGSTRLVYPPPDYISFGIETLAAGSSDLVQNAMLDEGTPGAFLAPVNITETVADHFTDNSWSTPQNQIDAGYPLYIQPTPAATGIYEHVHDFEATISGATVFLSWNETELDGSGTVTPYIATSADGVTYSAYTEGESLYASNFRYAKLKLEVTGDTQEALLRISGISTHAEVREKTKAGNDTSSASAAVTISVGSEWISLLGITVTPNGDGSTQYTPIVDFNYSTPNPTSFDVYILDADGDKAAVPFSWNVRGNIGMDAL